MFIPNFWKTHSKISETSAEEMQALMRQVAGKAIAGEREPQLMARAQRRINAQLPNDQQISDRRARGYWNAEYETIRPEHAAAARDMVSVLPIEEAIDAIDEQIEIHKSLLAVLLENRASLASHYRGPVGDFSPRFPLAAAEGCKGDQNSNPANDARADLPRVKPSRKTRKVFAGT